MVKQLRPEEIEARKQIRRIKRFVKRAEQRGFFFAEDVVPTLPKNVTWKTVERFKKKTPEVLYRKSVYVNPETAEVVKAERRLKEERVNRSIKAAATRKAESLGVPYNPPNEADKVIENIRDELGAFDVGSNGGYDVGFDYIPPDYSDLERAQNTIDEFDPANRDYMTRKKYGTKRHIEGYKERDKSLLQDVLDGAIAEEGKDVIAIRIQNNASEIQTLISEVLYSSGDAYVAYGRANAINKKVQRISEILRGRSLTAEESRKITEKSEELEEQIFGDMG